MRAITVQPGVKDSAQLDEVPEPDAADGALLVRALALGVCGTDREIIAAEHGSAPEGEQRLILGHESLGVVEVAPKGCGFAPGDHVVGIVRRPDPVPCPSCAAGEWDMCRNGRYTERGIKGRHGFGAERFRLEPEFAVKVDKDLGLSAVLMEPTSIVAKGWDHAERIAHRARTSALGTLLVTGAGPIGFLAALLGKQRGLDVHIFDRAERGPKPELTHDLGATYHIGDIANVLANVAPDILMECTGAAPVISAALGNVAPNGIVCLAGVSAAGRTKQIDIGLLNRTIVLENQAVFGTVNANRRHYDAAAAALQRADRDWLARLVNRRVPLARWHEALENRKDDIKVVIDFGM
ncbi:MAG TPA: glucose 1-dehydrogenase [Xanthobacteraceae bacterium]|nr:glucose 1-dehydrogenase [Xanthobacteraceae bacterium]